MTQYAAGQLYLDSGDVLWIAKTAGSSPTWAGVQGLSTVGTTAGAPTSGYWSKGQQYLDAENVLYVCTAGGTPGTWVVIAGDPPAGRGAVGGGVVIATGLSVVTGVLSATFLRGGMTLSTGGKFTIPAPGTYLVTATVTVQPTTHFGYVQAQILVNGVDYNEGAGVGIIGISSYQSAAAVDIVRCSTGDTIQMEVGNGTGSPLTSNAIILAVTQLR